MNLTVSGNDLHINPTGHIYFDINGVTTQPAISSYVDNTNNNHLLINAGISTQTVTDICSDQLNIYNHNGQLLSNFSDNVITTAGSTYSLVVTNVTNISDSNKFINTPDLSSDYNRVYLGNNETNFYAPGNVASSFVTSNTIGGNWIAIAPYNFTQFGPAFCAYVYNKFGSFFPGWAPIHVSAKVLYLNGGIINTTFVFSIFFYNSGNGYPGLSATVVTGSGNYTVTIRLDSAYEFSIRITTGSDSTLQTLQTTYINTIDITSHAQLNLQIGRTTTGFTVYYNVGSINGPIPLVGGNSWTQVYTSPQGVTISPDALTIANATQDGGIVVFNNFSAYASEQQSHILNITGNLKLTGVTNAANSVPLQVIGYGTDASGNADCSIYADHFVTALGYHTTSDQRVKKNVNDVSGSLDLLRLIRPVTYEYIDTTKGTGKRYGFLAQELEDKFDTAVCTHRTFLPSIYIWTPVTCIPYEGGTQLTVGDISGLEACTPGTLIKLMDKQYNTYMATLSALNVLTVSEDISTDTILVYGPETTEARCINHDQIMTVGIAATQQLDQQLQQMQSTIAIQQIMIEDLRVQINALKNKN